MKYLETLKPFFFQITLFKFLTVATEPDLIEKQIYVFGFVHRSSFIFLTQRLPGRRVSRILSFEESWKKSH